MSHIRLLLLPPLRLLVVMVVGFYVHLVDEIEFLVAAATAAAARQQRASQHRGVVSRRVATTLNYRRSTL